MAIFNLADRPGDAVGDAATQTAAGTVRHRFRHGLSVMLAPRPVGGRTTNQGADTFAGEHFQQ